MTFRNRTVAKRGRRRRTTWQHDARQNLAVNVAFVLAIVGALAILGGVLFSGWYGDHWASVMTINGKSYSLDDVSGRMNVLTALDTVTKQTYTDLRNAQKIGESDFNSMDQFLQSQAPVGQRAVSDLHDEAILESYAKSNGINVTDQDVQAQIDKDATVGELRHIKVIAVRPMGTDPTLTPSPSDVTAAQSQAQALLDRIKGGEKWDDVSKTTESGYFSSPSGDMGTATKDTFETQTAFQGDAALLDAAFKLPLNGYTDVQKGQDGIFRFATVTSVTAPQKDPNWESKLQKAGANLDAYHAEARGAALKNKVEAQIVNQYAYGETKQRHVQQIYFNSRYNANGATEVRARFAIFAPDKNPATASTVDAKDPKWEDAKKRAEDFYNQVKDNPSKFKDLTRAQSDDETWAPAGGELPYLSKDMWDTFGWTDTSQSSSSAATPPQADAVLFKTDPQPTTDQVFAPQKTDKGWVVLQFVDTRPGPSFRVAATRLRLNSGQDFGTVAQEQSDAPYAVDKGDMGWVSQYEMSAVEQDSIFNTKVGEVAQPVELVGSDGSTQATVIYKVLEERTAKPDAEDSERLKDLVYNNWFSEISQKATTSVDQTKLNPIVNPSQAPQQ